MKNLHYGLLILMLSFSSLLSQDCLECHDDLMQGRSVHVPVEEGDCLSCHEGKVNNHPDRRGKEFELTEDNMMELCGTCHDVVMDENTHSPVADGMCRTCHDVHRSTVSNLLVGSTGGDACKECHSTGTEGKKWVHGPAAVGACGVCHSSHGKTGNMLLNNPSKTEICYVCHSMKKEEFNAYSYVHSPVKDACTLCHDAHESDFKFTLNDGGEKFCLNCHETVKHDLENADSKHQAIYDEKKCLNCHAAHGGNYRYNLNQTTFDLCLSCHEKPIKSGNTTIPGMRSYLKRNKHWHGPVKDKNCSGCHVPHGSVNIRLLKYNYPEAFYAEFEKGNYQLCFECHPETNVLDANTTKLTNFRDRDVNLHYLHVNREKGRTCRACHQVHASSRPFHIRESVPFGATGWELPINYESKENGGSCLPGCHKKFSYTR